MIKQFSILIPVYNEVDNVLPLYAEISDALNKKAYQYEVIFIDDASSDGTLEKLLELCTHHDDVVLVRHKKNYGQSAGLVSGARAAQFPLLITLDGDGQNDPADIPNLIEQFDKSANCVVFGNRYKRNDSLLKKVSSKVGNGVRKTLLNDDCSDTGCSLKVFPKAIFLNLPHFNHLHRFLPALFKREGFTINNVNVNHRPRLRGESKYGVKNRLFVGIYDLMGVMWLKKRPCKPEVFND
jgi:glycosyltransferase involved in cell wall biosynthesis